MERFLKVEFASMTSDKKGAPVMVLKNHDRQKELFIAVNGIDANRLAIASLSFLGSSINTLPTNLISALGGSIERVILSRKEEGLLVCHLHIAQNGTVTKVECRPGEGVFVAQSTSADIIADESLFQHPDDKPKNLGQRIRELNTDDALSFHLF